jgi:hypothetical protein
MRYLKGSLNLKLCLGGNNIIVMWIVMLLLYRYCYVDWTRDANNRRSTMSYVLFVGAGAISWNCKRQPTIVRSTIEAKYMAASHGAIGLAQLEATPLKCNNQGCLAFAKNLKHYARTKHIDI